MRNRVAGSRTRSLVTMAVVAFLMVVPAEVAFAQDTVESKVPFNFAGPVGIAVAALGLSGLLLGLWRLRRKTTAARSADTEVMPTVDPEPRTPARTP